MSELELTGRERAGACVGVLAWWALWAGYIVSNLPFGTGGVGFWDVIFGLFMGAVCGLISGGAIGCVGRGAFHTWSWIKEGLDNDVIASGKREAQGGAVSGVESTRGSEGED